MKSRILAVSLCLFLSSSMCARVQAETIRIDRADEVDGIEDRLRLLKDTDNLNLLIFADVKELVVKDLRKVGLLNIHADQIKSVSFPNLEQARDVYLRGADIDMAEFPKLRIVSQTFYVKSGSLKDINVPELTSVGDLYLIRNQQLENVSAERLYDVGGITMEGNRNHDPESKIRLLSTGRMVTPEKRQASIQAEQSRRAMRINYYQSLQQPISPTGHPTSFGTIEHFPRENDRRMDPRYFPRPFALFRIR